MKTDMLLIPHIRIARRVNDVMRSKFQIKLSPAIFALGSIFPDIAKHTNTGYHDVHEAVSTVQDYQSRQPRSRWGESFRLGIICHYTADSFCQVHIHHNDYTLRQHMKYEMQQSRQMKRQLGTARELAMACSYPTRAAALEAFLQDHREFVANRRSYVEETNAVVKNCVLVLHGLGPRGKALKTGA